MSEPSAWTLVEAAAAIRTKQVSSRELTEVCLGRIAAHDPQLKAFIRIDGDAALTAAEKADADLAAGTVRGPLHGVPLAHKDQFERDGQISTCGSKTRNGVRSTKTATCLTRLDAAGALDLGTLNMSEFAFHIWGFNRLLGPPHNPWDVDRIAGASSGGSAAALAARLIFGSIGSDSGGSIRFPAAMSGVVGLLPTHGRLSRHRMLGSSRTVDAPGPMARTVADCAVLLGLLAGPDAADPWSSHHPVADYGSQLEAPIAGKTIGVVGDALLGKLPPDLRAAYQAAAQTYAALGASLIEIDLVDFEPLSALAALVFASEAAATHARALRTHGDDMEPQIRERLLQGFAYPAAAYIEAVNARANRTRSFVNEVYANAGILLLPSVPDVAPRLADVVAGTPPIATPLEPGYFMRAINYLGLPALAVPCGFSGEGLPMGFQLVGRPFAEGTLLNFGHVFQCETDFHKKIPNGFDV
jgi:aspartyl-tRNA(Asn)/glutamyl-tRNA(Gln) amidotransferase subunit A